MREPGRAGTESSSARLCLGAVSRGKDIPYKGWVGLSMSFSSSALSLLWLSL